MWQFRDILKKAGLFLLAYLLTLGFFSLKPVDQVYGNLFSSLNRPFADWFIPNSYVLMEGKPSQPGFKDGEARVVIANQKQVDAQIAEAKSKGLRGGIQLKMVDFPINYRQVGLYPLIFLFSLILISPGDWKKKFRAMLIGFALLTLLSGFRIMITALVNYYNNDWLDVVELSEAGFSLVQRFFTMMNLGVTMIVVIMIWALTMLRKDFFKSFAILSKSR